MSVGAGRVPIATSVINARCQGAQMRALWEMICCYEEVVISLYSGTAILFVLDGHVSTGSRLISSLNWQSNMYFT